MPFRFAFRPPRRTPPAARLAAPLLAALLAGCSSAPTEIARVGSRTISADDFMTVARANAQQYPEPGEAGRRMLLDDLLRRELMLAAADAMGLERDSALTRLRHDLEDQLLARTLYQRLAPMNISVSAAEVDSFYRWRGIEAHVQLIYVPNREAADAAMDALRSGLEFGAAADRFTPTRTLPAHGDLGYLQPGALVDPLDTMLRTAPIGRILGPVDAPGEGWFIVRLLDRRKVPNRPPIDVERSWITGVIQQRKQRSASTRAFMDLAAKYNVTVIPDAAAELFMIANRQSFAPQGQGDPTAEERTRVLVRYEDPDGHPLTYTLNDAISDMETRGADRPNFQMLPAITTWLQTQVVQRAAVLEARRRHYGEEPALAKQIEERINNQVLERVYNGVVGAVQDATPEEITAAYERHAAGYMELRMAHVLHVTLADSAAAATLAMHGAHAGTLREAAKMVGAEGRVVEERVPFPNPREPWKGMQSALLAMSPNEWVGPMRVPNGWMLLQVLDKEQVRTPFVKLPPAIQQSLHDEALAVLRDRRLAAFTDSLRTVVRPFEVHPERLNRIPWPVPPAGPTPGT